VTIKILFYAWGFLVLGDGLVAFVCARGFWGEWRKSKAKGEPDPTCFWTFVMLACFSVEGLGRAVTLPLAPSDPACFVPASLALNIIFRTVKAAGMWLWYLRAVR
jgi:hypothetical protein